MSETITSEYAWLQFIFSNPQVTIPLAGLSIPIILGLIYYWHETRKIQSNNRLKRDMLERGMSAQEIERVLNAGEKPKNKNLSQAQQHS